MDTPQFIKEIQEEVQFDQWMRFFQRYRNWILSGILGLAISISGYLGWESYHKEQCTAWTTVCVNALRTSAGGEYEKALAELDTVAHGAPKHLALYAKTLSVAVLSQALNAQSDAKLRSDWTQKREKALGALTQSSASNPILHDLATYLQVCHRWDTLQKEEFEKKIMPALNQLAHNKSPYRPLANELLGHIALAKSDVSQARSYFSSLVRDRSTAQALHQRAKILTETLPVVENEKS